MQDKIVVMEVEMQERFIALKNKIFSTSYKWFPIHIGLNTNFKNWKKIKEEKCKKKYSYKLKNFFASPKILVLALQVITKTKEKHQLLIESGKQLSQYVFFFVSKTLRTLLGNWWKKHIRNVIMIHKKYILNCGYAKTQICSFVTKRNVMVEGNL